MKRIVFLSLFLLAISVISCKKSPVNKTENTELSSKDSTQAKIDFDWTKMNYNMISSLIFDVQINPEKYAGKRIKASGNFHSSIYENRRYFSVLVWDPTGCCPAGFDFIPPTDMKYPEDFPSIDDKITVICVFEYSDADQDSFKFLLEEIIKE